MFGAFQGWMLVDVSTRHALHSPVHDHSLSSVHIFHWHWYGPAIEHIPTHRAPFLTMGPGKSVHVGNIVSSLPS